MEVLGIRHRVLEVSVLDFRDPGVLGLRCRFRSSQE